MASIGSTLSRSAGEYAQRALESYVTGAIADFVVFGGIAIEHALKAKLAKENVLFLAKRNDFKSALDLHRSEGDAGRLQSGTRTIGAADAIEYFCQLEPEMRGLIEPAHELVALRNGQAHLGVNDETQKRRVFVVFLRSIESLLNIESKEFWSPHHDLVSTTLDQESKEMERLVQEKMASARVSFDKGLAVLPDEQRNALLVLIESRVASRVDDSEILWADCPVCSSPAIVMGLTEQTDWDVDYDDGVATSAWPVLTFFAGTLECEACGLILDGDDEFEAAGLKSSWLNEAIDLDAWIEENLAGEPDY